MYWGRRRLDRSLGSSSLSSLLTCARPATLALVLMVVAVAVVHTPRSQSVRVLCRWATSTRMLLVACKYTRELECLLCGDCVAFCCAQEALCLCLCFILKIITVVRVHLSLLRHSPSQECTVHMQSHPIECSYFIVLVVLLPELYSMFLFCFP